MLRGLDYDYVPDIPPHVDLESLSTADLREKIARSFRSHRNWTSPTGPTPSRLKAVRLSTARTDDDRMHGVKLIPGGHYIVLVTDRVLELRRVESTPAGQSDDANLVWKDDDPKFARHGARSYDFILVDNGNSLIIAVCMELLDGEHNVLSYVFIFVYFAINKALFHAITSRSYLRVIRLDLKSYESVTLASSAVPYRASDLPIHMQDVRVTKQYAMMKVYCANPGHTEIILMDWKNKLSVALRQASDRELVSNIMI